MLYYAGVFCTTCEKLVDLLIFTKSVFVSQKLERTCVVDIFEQQHCGLGYLHSFCGLPAFLWSLTKSHTTAVSKVVFKLKSSSEKNAKIRKCFYGLKNQVLH